MSIIISYIVAGIILLIGLYTIHHAGKIKRANQSLEKQEQEQQLRIKDLEREYAEKLNEQNNLINNKKIELEQVTSKVNQEYNDNILKITQQIADLTAEVKGLEEKRSTIISTLEQEAQKSGEIFKNQQLQIAQEQVEKEEKEMWNNFGVAKEQAKQEYLTLLEDLLSSTNEKIVKTTEQLNQELEKLAEAKAKADAAVEVNRRNEMDRLQKDFYRLQLSDVDIEEIKKLRSVEPFLRDKEPLNKVIYKCYYEKPYTDLIGRVFKGTKPCGIYKITNLLNGMSYVGQSTNVPERWRQHVKRGVGAEPATQNKLYTVMKEVGVENFMFELIEECKAADLTDREKYWTDFYQAQAYGYSIKKG